MRDFKNLTPLDHLNLIWRRRWYFIIPALLVSACGVIYAWKAPRFYKSETRILAESAIISDNTNPIMRTTNEDRINAIREQVQSRTFIERLIEEFQLYGYGRLSDFAMDQAVYIFRRNFQILNTSDNSFTISFSAGSPELAREVAKRVADILIQATETARRNKAIDADRFIDDEMRKAEVDLKAHEEKIKQFKNEHLGELPEQTPANLSTLSQLRSQLTIVEGIIQNAHDQRKMTELRLQEQRQLTTLTNTTTRVETLLRPSVVAREPAPNPLVQQLAGLKATYAEYSSKWTPEHPEIKKLAAQIKELEQQLAKSPPPPNSAVVPQNTNTANADPEPGSASQPGQERVADPAFNLTIAQIKAEIESRDNEVERQTKERDEINKQIKLYQTRLSRAPSLEQELIALNRENDALRTHYTTLQNRKFGAQLAASLATNNKNETYRVIDDANLPERPEKPGRFTIALVGLAAGVVVGFGAVYTREYLDNTIGTAEDAEKALQLPVLALVPDISSRKRLDQHRGLKNIA
jgi:polysaccharide biosynthesis transport protein